MAHIFQREEAGIVSLLFYWLAANLGRGMKGRESGPGAVIEKLAKTDGEDEIAENGVIQAGEQQRAGSLVSEREEKSADHAESHGQRIPENDMDEPERHRAGEQHAPTAAEKRLVAMQEKRPVEKFLWVHRDKGVEKKNQRP